MPAHNHFGRFLVRVASAIALLGAGVSARADVWAYVDARGIMHFAAEKLDDRYELFFRGASPGSPSNPELAAAEAAAAADAAAAEAAAAAAPKTSPSAPTPSANYGASPYTLRLASYLERTSGYQLARPHLQEAALTHQIDEELLKALIATESGFDPQAVSPKGAIGLMQVMPATAARFGVSGDAHQPIERKLAEPQTNIRTGARYLRFLLNLFPNQLELALAAYNAGEGAVQRAGNRIPNYTETQNYVRTVMQLYTLLKPPPSPPPARASTAPSPAVPAMPSAPVRAAMPGLVPGRSSMPPSIANPLASSMTTLPATPAPTPAN